MLPISYHLEERSYFQVFVDTICLASVLQRSDGKWVIVDDYMEILPDDHWCLFLTKEEAAEYFYQVYLKGYTTHDGQK